MAQPGALGSALSEGERPKCLQSRPAPTRSHLTLPALLLRPDHPAGRGCAKGCAASAASRSLWAPADGGVGYALCRPAERIAYPGLVGR